MQPKKVTAGQPFQFSANFYNRLVDAVAWVEKQKQRGGAGQTGMRSGATNVKVKYVGATDLPKFSVLEVTDRLGDEDQFIWLKSLQGDEIADLTSSLVITQAPCKQNEIVETVIAGATMARVNINSTSHKYAKAVVGQTYLESTATPDRFSIVDPLTGSGVTEVLVTSANAGSAQVSKLIVAPSGGIPPRVQGALGSATCDVWDDDGDELGHIQDTGEDILVYNWATSAVLANGERFGIASWNGSMWLAVSDDCNDEGTTVQPDPGTGTGSGVGGGGGGTVGWPADDPYLDIAPAVGSSSAGVDLIGDVDAGKIPPPP